MKVLFVTSTPFLSEPLGAMLLAAICRRAGHDTRLAILRSGGFLDTVRSYQPDVIAYSAMSTELRFFRDADAELRKWMEKNGKRIVRIMGGPHPTYWPAVAEELNLDAICQGDGDLALPEYLKCIESGGDPNAIPNMATSGKGARNKHLFEDLDSLPFAHREDYYKLVPYCRESGLRSFIASRGCPYDCTYCYNHAFKEMFQGCGPILRRCSVQRLIAEIEYVVRTYPPVRLIRFGDDTFSHKADAWLEEFVRQYKTRIGIPFYCLMRSNTLTDDTARLLSEAGCQAVGMSLEAGSDAIRNGILKRNLPEETVIRSFELAKRYKLNAFANSMLAIPGTTLADDFETLDFARRIRPAAPYFGVCCPYPGTQMWRMAVDAGHLDPQTQVGTHYLDRSVLKSYTQREKETQSRICNLGVLYVHAPRWLTPALLLLMRTRLPLTRLTRLGLFYADYRLATRIFPQAIPRTPASLLRLVRDTFRTFG